MAETLTAQLSTPSRSRFHFSWIPALFFRPRSVFTKIGAQNKAVWLTPMLVLTVTALLLVGATGWLKTQAALINGPALPPDFEYYTPEQQEQYLQIAQSTQGPVFAYVLPGVAAVLGVWFGWLLTGGLLHLVTTLLGGRGDTTSSMNLTAWASLPFALRDLVRVAALVFTRTLITNEGLSGFAPAGEGGWVIFLTGLLALVDLYLVWRFILIAVGLGMIANLSRGKAFGVAAITVLTILLVQALLGFGIASLSSLTVVRPFFF